MDSKPSVGAIFSLATAKKASVLLVLSAVLWQPSETLGGKLIDMGAATAPDGSVQLRLTFDGPAPQPKGYNIEQPPRVSIDLPDTNSSLPKYHELGFDAAENVTILESGNRTRLVVSQKEPQAFTTRQDGSVMLITIGGALSRESRESKNTESITSASPYGPPGYSSAYGAAAPVAASGIHKKVKDIDFKRGDDGAGNVIITMSEVGVPVDINEMAGRIQLMFEGDVIPEKLRNRLDVTDFATPVKFVDARIEDGNAVIMIEPKGGYDYLAYQADNKLTISVKAETGKGYVKNRKGLAYQGEKVTFDFQNIEVRTVLQLIADINNMNLVASDTVTGNVTLRLKNVPWDHALDIVLKAKGLDKRMAGNVMTVAPAAEIAAREKEQLENEKQIRELAPVYTDLIVINYADAKDVAAILGGGEEGNNGLLTELGSVQIVERTNSLLIKDTQEKLDEVKGLISDIDIPVRQVLIEARIVNLSAGYSKNLGVKWSGTFNRENSKWNIGSEIFTDVGEEEESSSSSGISNLGIGFVTNGTLLNLELSALISDNGGEIVSQPKIITANKKAAIITSGSQIPFQAESESGGTTTEFKDAVLELKVTPQITPDGKVIMDLEMKNDEVDDIDKGTIKTSSVTTQVLVGDGETVVLGGVFKQDKKNAASKVPLLGDLPYLGYLFKNTAVLNKKDEMMIFITPRIIEEGVAAVN